MSRNEAQHNRKVLKSLPADTLLQKKLKKRQRKGKKTPGKDYFHKMKLIQQKMKAPHDEAVGVRWSCVEGQPQIWGVNGTQLLLLVSSGHPSTPLAS